MALLEQDIKKVVALSTLSQIGFSSLVLGVGLNFFCLFHLVRHALFKSCLFIQIGFLIYKSIGQQDGRFYINLKFSSFFIQFQILLTLFCLCGLFFSRGLVSKDFVLEYFFSFNLGVFIFLIFFFSVFFTFFYRFRI
jgi:NADH-ubiquinone oxidoreductase chain 5